jgi:outer membrane protein assembly factor BamE (lipoprotein component of BamABCDE complex)
MDVEFFNIEGSLNGEKVELDTNSSRPTALRHNGTVYVSSRALSSLVRLTIVTSNKYVYIKSDHLSDGTPIYLEKASLLKWDMTEEEITKLLGYPVKREVDWGWIYLKYNLVDGRVLKIQSSMFYDELIAIFALNPLKPSEPAEVILNYRPSTPPPEEKFTRETPTPMPTATPTPSPTPSPSPTPRVEPVIESIKVDLRGIKVTVEGETSDLINKALVHNGIIYLPILEVANAFDTELGWADENTARLVSDTDRANMYKVGPPLSYDELYLVKRDMTIKQVVALIGYPHYSRGSGRRYDGYLMEDGRMANIFYGEPRVKVRSLMTRFENDVGTARYIIREEYPPTPIPTAEPQY